MSNHSWCEQPTVQFDNITENAFWAHEHLEQQMRSPRSLSYSLVTGSKHFICMLLRILAFDTALMCVAQLKKSSYAYMYHICVHCTVWQEPFTWLSSLVPRPLPPEERPGTHCLCMREIFCYIFRKKLCVRPCPYAENYTNQEYRTRLHLTRAVEAD